MRAVARLARWQDTEIKPDMDCSYMVIGKDTKVATGFVNEFELWDDNKRRKPFCLDHRVNTQNVRKHMAGELLEN